MRTSFKMAIATTATSAAVIATVGAATANGNDNHHDYDPQTTVADIHHVGFIVDDGDTAVVKIDYTCPDGADAFMKVWLSQEQDDDGHDGYSKHDHGDGDTVTGSERVYNLDCTGSDERAYVPVDADDYGEWERGDAQAEALLISESSDDGGYDKRRHGNEFEKYFTYSDVCLVDKSHDGRR